MIRSNLDEGDWRSDDEAESDEAKIIESREIILSDNYVGYSIHFDNSSYPLLLKNRWIKTCILSIGNLSDILDSFWIV